MTDPSTNPLSLNRGKKNYEVIENARILARSPLLLPTLLLKNSRSNADGSKLPVEVKSSCAHLSRVILTHQNRQVFEILCEVAHLKKFSESPAIQSINSQLSESSDSSAQSPPAVPTRPAFVRVLAQRAALTMHTAFNRPDNTHPAPITVITSSK